MPKILHFSDFHFSKITLSPLQFLSKRWIGNANLILTRRLVHIKEHLEKIPLLAKKEGVDVVVFTGDASTTGRSDELLKAKDYLEEFKKHQIKVLAIPGNHDHYTKNDYVKRRFYDFLENAFNSPFSLRKDGVEIGSLSSSWWYLLIDSIVATPVYSSQGLFSEELEKKVVEALKLIPSHAKIMMVNHFPFFNYDHPRKALKHADRLEEIIRQDPRVQIYLHGHTHRHCIADLRNDSLPIILDSGSSSHSRLGSFNLYDLKEDQLDVAVYKIKEDGWKKMEQTSFKWEVKI